MNNKDLIEKLDQSNFRCKDFDLYKEEEWIVLYCRSYDEKIHFKHSQVKITDNLDTYKQGQWRDYQDDSLDYCIIFTNCHPTDVRFGLDTCERIRNRIEEFENLEKKTLFNVLEQDMYERWLNEKEDYLRDRLVNRLLVIVKEYRS